MEVGDWRCFVINACTCHGPRRGRGSLGAHAVRQRGGRVNSDNSVNGERAPSSEDCGK